MTKNDKRVQMLSNNLHEMDEALLVDLARYHNETLWGGNTEILIDGSSYFECDIAFGEVVEEYQVYRKFGIGIVDKTEFEYQGETYIGTNNEVWDEHYEEVEDTIELITEIDWMNEFGQIWLNTRTGQVTMLTKTDDYLFIANDARLHVTDGTFYGQSFFDHHTRLNIMYEATADESYMEISVHPALSKFGHKQFSTFSWEADKDNAYYGENIVREWKKAIKYNAMVVARRHGYIQFDTPLFSDYLDLLMWHGDDIRNPKNICPPDLQEAFDKLSQCKAEYEIKYAEKREREERIAMERRAKADIERLEETLADDGKCNTIYQSKMKDMLSIEICGGGFVAMPLHSVREFYDEGTAMNHCVFRGGYYKKFNSLILSVRDEQGNRLATVEYNIKEKTVVQCYAEFDKIPLKDEQIRKFIAENLPKHLRLAA